MKTPTEIWRAAPRIRDGSLRPIDLVEACLERIADQDGSIGAWVTIDAAGARRSAQRLGQEVADSHYRGPLHGIPVGVKDIVDVADMPTRAGSNLTDPSPRTDDAPVVAGLRQAGAVVLGKTVTTPFAGFDPSPTRNPINLAHTPGGSSSGSAAAVAAG
ncbi:MAG: amidase family protein, partial [Pirellulales bacterium]